MDPDKRGDATRTVCIESLISRAVGLIAPVTRAASSCELASLPRAIFSICAPSAPTCAHLAFGSTERAPSATSESGTAHGASLEGTG